MKLYKLNINYSYLNDFLSEMPQFIIYGTYEDFINQTARFMINLDDEITIIETIDDDDEKLCLIYTNQNDIKVLDRLNNLRVFT